MPTINQYFTSADKKIYFDLRYRKDYTNEIKKIDGNDLLIIIMLKAAATTTTK